MTDIELIREVARFLQEGSRAWERAAGYVDMLAKPHTRFEREKARCGLLMLVNDARGHEQKDIR